MMPVNYFSRNGVGIAEEAIYRGDISHCQSVTDFRGTDIYIVLFKNDFFFKEKTVFVREFL